MAKEVQCPDMPRSVHFGFRKDDKLPQGFDNLTIGQEVTLTVTGKVASLSQDSYGSGFSIENFSVKIAKKSDLRWRG